MSARDICEIGAKQRLIGAQAKPRAGASSAREVVLQVEPIGQQCNDIPRHT
jgi:hypothetical protein